MSGVATAIVGGAVIGGYVQDQASRRAVDAQQEASQAALSSQERIYQQQREDQQPWREAGGSALNVLMGQLGVQRQPGEGEVSHGAIRHDMPVAGQMGAPEQTSFLMKDLESDPGYQFRLREGEKAIERSAAARGGLATGSTLKALQGYGQGLASQEFQNAYQRHQAEQATRYGRYQDYMNRLSSLAGLGQTATSQLGAASSQYGANVGSALTGMGNASAAAELSRGQNMANIIGSGMGALGMYYGLQRKTTPQDGGSSIFSDAALKMNVKPISSEDLDEFRSTIKPYFFDYISDEYGKGDWAGVMAQDLEKSKLGRMTVFENESGHKKIDLKKLVSILVASQAKGAE